MSRIVDDIQSARAQLPPLRATEFAYHHVDAARRATHEESDGYNWPSSSTLRLANCELRIASTGTLMESPLALPTESSLLVGRSLAL